MKFINELAELSVLYHDWDQCRSIACIEILQEDELRRFNWINLHSVS